MFRLGRPAAAMAATGALLASGCGTPPGGDPGGRRLAELAGDGAFAGSPPGATRVLVKRTAARYAQPGFEGGGWHGPSVVVTFRSAAPPARVFAFYAGRAAAAGWRPTSRGALGFIDVWKKTYPDGAPATLLLSLLMRLPAHERDYQLAGGVAPVLPH